MPLAERPIKWTPIIIVRLYSENKWNGNGLVTVIQEMGIYITDCNNHSDSGNGNLHHRLHIKIQPTNNYLDFRELLLTYKIL